MAQLKSIQRGTTTLLAASVSTTATITAVTLGKSFVRISFSGDGDRFAQHVPVTAILSSTTQITFTKYGNAGTPQNVTIQWEVVEYTSGVSVQTGTYTASATIPSPITITIAATTIGKSFPFVHYWSGVNWEYTGADAMRITLPSSTQLRFTWDRPTSTYAASLRFTWQVIDYDDCDVNIYNHAVSGTSSSDTIASVDTTKTMLIPTFGTTAASGQWNCRNLWRATLAGATTIGYSRNTDDSGYTEQFDTWVVEFTDSTTVTRYVASFASTDVTKNVAVTVSDMSKAFLNPTNGSASGNGSENNRNNGYSWKSAIIDAELVSTTQVTASRFAADSNEAIYNFEIIESKGGRIFDLMPFLLAQH